MKFAAGMLIGYSVVGLGGIVYLGCLVIAAKIMVWKEKRLLRVTPGTPK